MFIVLKDPHLRMGIQPPIGRKESFHTEIKTKLDFVRQYAKEHEVKHIVFTGDVLDIKAPSKYDYPIIRTIKNELSLFRDDGIQLWTVLGNHDLPMASRDMYQFSVIHDFVRDGYLKLLSKEPLVLENCTVYGVDYTSDQQQFRAELEAIDDIEVSEDTYKVVVVHEHIIPDKEYEGHVNFFTYSKAIEMCPTASMWVCGHLHRGFPTKKQKGVKFVNPWSMTRLARNYYVLGNEHIPTMVHVKENLLSEDIPLPCVSFEEGFNEQDFEKAVELEMDLAGFATTIAEFITDGDTSLESLNLPEKVRAKVEEYILRAKGTKD